MKTSKRRAAAYRVYVRTVDGDILLWTETATADPDVADEAIRDLLTTEYFEGSPFVLIALYRGNLYFTHEYDTPDDGSHVVPQMLSNLGRIDWLRYPSVH
ncbi:hypothetical protein HH212_19770 [Massilia forsythiae]|uniref:Uncharacterized protein n=1 Tax=Massilia forsythiae TaxID=2728020 RepID=A0A7Z2VZH4_9BURK|nr:hypothetical protein [Massilia forsythiae]QJE01979.1 hypothetical protein HH212_19770 [Massilia forsythiae]